MMLTINCRVFFTTFIDIVLLQKQLNHSMRVMQVSQEEKLLTVYDKLKDQQTISVHKLTHFKIHI